MDFMHDDIIQQKQNLAFWSAFFKMEKMAQIPLGLNEAFTIVAKDASGQKNTYTGIRLKKTRKNIS